MAQAKGTAQEQPDADFAAVKKLFRPWQGLEATMKSDIQAQMFWCAMCGEAFVHAGELRRKGGRQATRHGTCGAWNEIKVSGETEQGRDLYTVVGEVMPAN